MTRYPTLRDALVVVEHGAWVVRDIGLLDTVVQRPRAVMYGTELYPGLHLKAATLLDSANRLDPLVDGNQQLSLVLADVFFAMNGRRLESGQDEMVELILTIASEHLPLEDIATWLADHTH